MEGGVILTKDLGRVRMKERRLELNLTHEQVADKLGIDRSTYTNIENGNRNPSFDLSLKIKRLFKVKSDDIFLVNNVAKKDKQKTA